VATNNFGFLELSGSNTAGYNSINALITSIDNELYDRVAKPGMIMMWDTSDNPLPTGWSSLGNTVTGLPTLTSSKVYIKKDA
jgi:hypothetical protein